MMSRDQRLLETLVQLADTLVNDYDVLDLFYHLVEAAPVVLDVAEAGLLIKDPHGQLQVVAVTGERVRSVELLQVQLREGPCVDAFETGTQVSSSLIDPAEAAAWPQFTDAAREAGFGWVHAIPMRLRDHVLGAFNLFRAEDESLSEPDLVAAQALADVASIAILQDRAAHDSTLLVGQLQGALNSRVVIEQAKGVVAQRTGLPMEQAFARLRRHARDHNMTLRQTASEVVSGALEPESLPPAEA